MSQPNLPCARKLDHSPTMEFRSDGILQFVLFCSPLCLVPESKRRQISVGGGAAISSATVERSPRGPTCSVSDA